ncbi:ABC transporter substrate-binding protein, partial [Methanocaldococcus sp.]
MKKFLTFCILFVVVFMSMLSGCVNSEHPNNNIINSTSLSHSTINITKNITNSQIKTPIVEYAKNFKLTYYDKNGNEVNPYTNGDKWAYKVLIDALGQKFLLKNASEPVPSWAKEKLGDNFKVINVPLKRVVVMSSTEIALMEAINNDGSVIGSVKGIMWGKAYKWYFNNIKEGLENGSIIDVGSTSNPNWDKIIELKPQVIFVYPGYDGNKVISKCKELGITYVADAEYLENDPLGRCEWVKMFAAFYNKEPEAKRYFDKIVDNCLMVMNKTKNCPKVTVAWGYNSQWGCYVPENNSYVAKEITIYCNGDYIFKDLNGTGSAKIDYETFAERARNADVWVIPSSVKWLTTFKKDNPGYETFKAVKNGRVFCESEDYWQLGLLKTDEVIMDLATIMHPEAFKGRKTHFFLKYNIENNTATPF